MDTRIRLLERALAQEASLENKLRLYREKRRLGRPVLWTEFGFEAATVIDEVNKTTRIYFVSNRRLEIAATGIGRVDRLEVSANLVTGRSRVIYAVDKETLTRLARVGWETGGSIAWKNGGVEGLKLDENIQEIMYEVLG